MSENELSRIEDVVLQALKKKQTSFLNLETIVKIGFTLVMGALAYAGMSNKIDNSASDISEIKVAQTKEYDKMEVQMRTMTLQIQTCQTQIAVMNQQIKDLQTTQK